MGKLSIVYHGPKIKMDSDIFERIFHYASTNTHRLPPPEDLYTAIISVIIGQEIAFIKARSIRSALYAQVSKPLNPNIVYALSQEFWESTGLSVNRIDIIRDITFRQIIGQNLLEVIHLIPGIGEWSIKSIYLMTHLHPDILLLEDKWIRDRLILILGLSPITTTKKLAMVIGDKWKGSRSLISRFFWRLPKEGVQYLLDGRRAEEIPLI